MRAKAERLTEIAARMLAGHGFKPDRRPVVAQAFGRALASTSPSEPHGQLLASARHRPRPRSAPTWMAAVAAGILPGGRRGHRGPHLPTMVRVPLLMSPRLCVRPGLGLWRELATAMNWSRKPKALCDGIIRGLAEAGWLTIGTSARSLRPGPSAERAISNRGRARKPAEVCPADGGCGRQAGFCTRSPSMSGSPASRCPGSSRRRPGMRSWCIWRARSSGRSGQAPSL